MSAEEQSPDDKPFEASERKLREARRKGETAQSADLTTAAVYGGLALCAAIAGPALLAGLGRMLRALLADADSLSGAIFVGSGRSILAAILLPPAWLLVAIGGVGMVAVMLSVSAQQSFTFAPAKLRPRLSRLNPIKAAGQKFGRQGLGEFAKSAARLIAISLALGTFLAARAGEILAALYLPPGELARLIFSMSLDFLVVVFLITFAIGVVDVVWQRALHARTQRMSLKELRDEQKESEGDPWVKSQRRDRAVAIATNRMLADVPSASVVIVNPSHYAIALRWDRAAGGAPVCVAKGVDEVALQIRRRAVEAGVPLRRDPPTARALWSAVRIGEEIPPDHYRAVALAIRFADRIRSGGGRAGA